MQPNEIRVNNWFNLEFVGPFKWEYPHFEEYVKDKAHGCDVEGCVISDKVEPIALTPEVLEKAGFVISHTNDVGLPIALRPGNLEETFFYLHDYKLRNGSNVIVRYLHQLQNLYWCLCGEELTVNL